MATSIAVQQEALTRAVSSQSLSNYATIIRGFMAKGLPESEISPRENVFTYNAWKALGRQVRKGEHGVKCLTFIVQRDKRTGREEKRPWTTTVFHVSQTEKIGAEYESVAIPVAPDNMPCYNAILYNEPDATGENVPYAGEDETGRPRINSLEIVDHDATPGNEPYAGEAPLSIEELHDELTTSGMRFEHVKTDEVDYLLTPVQAEVIPAPAPKDSAYDRAMRGEQVSIMDIISDLNQPKRKRQGAMLPRRLQAASYQSKTVEF